MTDTPSTPTPGGLSELDRVNAILGQLIPTVGLAFGLINLVREMIRRRQDNEPELTLGQMADLIEGGAASMTAASDAWFAAHPEYDPSTGRRRS